MSGRAAAPLDGVRVLEIAEGVAGPVCGLQMADMGAEVFKIEPPEGDRAREWGPALEAADSAIFEHLNRGKHSVALDLERSRDRDVLEAALPAFDIVVAHMDPFDRAATGFDARAIQERHPRLVVCEIDDFGADGPDAGKAGSELTAQAHTGFIGLVGDPGSAPCRAGFEVAWVGAGMHAYQAALAALMEREDSGAGQYVSVNVVGQLLSLITIMFAARSRPDKWLGFHLNGPFWRADIGWETADGQVTFDFRHGVREGWVKFCEAVGLGHLPSHPDYEDWRSTIYNGDRKDEFGGVYRPKFAQMTCEQASDLINGFDGISVKFHDYAEFLEHPQMRHMDPLDTVPDAPQGARTQVGTPFRLTAEPPAREHAPAPRLDSGRAAFLALAESGRRA